VPVTQEVGSEVSVVEAVVWLWHGPEARSRNLMAPLEGPSTAIQYGFPAVMAAEEMVI